MINETETITGTKRQVAKRAFAWAQLLFVLGILLSFTALMGLSLWGTSLNSEVQSLRKDKAKLEALVQELKAQDR